MMKKNKNKIVLALCVWAASDCGAADIITTIAGNGTVSSTGDGGPATAATLNAPYGVFQDSSGNIYIAEFGGNRVRKIDTSGIITTIAGTGAASTTGDGSAATSATLNKPIGLTKDASGNLLISENTGNVVRKVNTSGIISTLVPGLSGPFQLSWDSSGNLLIADCNNIRVLKVNSSSGATVGTIATTYAPRGVWGDSSGNIFIGEYNGSSASYIVNITTIVAGTGSLGSGGDGGPATSATMNYPYFVSADASGNIFFADVSNQRIRKFTVGGNINTVAGGGGGFADGGSATATTLNGPVAVYPTSSGNLLIADSANHRIRIVFPAPAEPATQATAVNFTSVGSSSMTVNWTNGTGSKRIVLMKAGGAPTAPTDYKGYAANASLGAGSDVGSSSYAVYRGTGSSVTVNGLTPATTYHVAVYEFNDAGDFGTDNYLTTSPATGSQATKTLYVTTIAGDGTAAFLDGIGTAAKFNQPYGVFADIAGNLYVADPGNNRIRKIDLATGTVTTLAGQAAGGFTNGIGTAAQFSNPYGVSADIAGNLYVADYSNNSIRKIVISSGAVTTFASGFNLPCGVSADSTGTNLYVADRDNNRICKIVISSGVVTTLASGFNKPDAVCTDSADNLYVADTGNHLIRKIVIRRGYDTGRQHRGFCRRNRRCR